MIFSKLLMKLFGWKIDTNFPPKGVKQYVLIAAPHTSNWDFPFAIATFNIMKVKIRFTIKNDWTKFPFGLVTKPMGAIGIDRSKKVEGDGRKSMVDYMADLFTKHEELALIVTAESTRSKVEQWKTGFYHIAKKANVPIALGFLDYKNKIAGIREKLLYPSDDMQKDMEEIMAFYKDIIGKIPENFTIDKRFA